MSIHLRGLHPQVRARAELAVSWANHYKIPVTITSGHRTWAEQTKLRSQFEGCISRGEIVEASNPNPGCRWPANRPGDSAHNYAMAWDSVTSPAQQANWNYLRRYAGFDVPAHDAIHAEVPNWRSFTPRLPTRG